MKFVQKDLKITKYTVGMSARTSNYLDKKQTCRAYPNTRTTSRIRSEVTAFFHSNNCIFY